MLFLLLLPALQGTKAEAQAVVDAAARAMHEAPQVGWFGALCCALVETTVLSETVHCAISRWPTVDAACRLSDRACH